MNPRKMTFDDVCEYLKTESGWQLDAASQLLGLIMIVVPLLFPPSVGILPAFGLLGVKNEMTKLFRSV